MRFAHLADCHIGGWREPKLRDANLLAFCTAVDSIIRQRCDFLLIAGDLFNTAVPALDSLKATVTKLRELREAGIPVYLVPGSHDYSPSGKSIIDVLEEASLVVDVARADEQDGRLLLRYTIDPKTGARIAGLPGRKGSLERSYFAALDAGKREGYAIFLLHTTLAEYKPKELAEADATPLSLLPKGFDYYAAGHVHYVFERNEPGIGTIAYPGPLFPNNFKELEELKHGGFYIVEDGVLRWEPVQIIIVRSLSLDCDAKTPAEVEAMVQAALEAADLKDAVLTLRLRGTLLHGRPSEIGMARLMDVAHAHGASLVLRNTAKLLARDVVEVKVQESADDIESTVIREHCSGIGPAEERVALELMRLLSAERHDGEKVADFEKRVIQDAKPSVEELVEQPVDL